MTEHRFTSLAAAEDAIRHQFDTTPAQVILACVTSREVVVLADLTGEDLAATLLALDGELFVYTHQYIKRRDPWYAPARKRATYVYKHAVRHTSRLSGAIPLRIDGSLSHDFRQQDLFAHALFYTAFRLRVYVLRDTVTYTLTLAPPSVDEWDAAPDGSLVYYVTQNPYLGAVSHTYINQKDAPAPRVQ